PAGPEPPAAAAGLAAGDAAAAVRHARQRFERDVDDGALRLALDLRDQAETTAVVLACGVVEAPIRVCPHRHVVVVGGRVAWGSEPGPRARLPDGASTRSE